MRVIRARNLSVGLLLLLATGCSSSGGFSSASMPSWWPWGKKTPTAPETGLADNGYPQSPAQAAQQAAPGANYGPPAYGYPQTDPALAYGNPSYGTPAYGNTPASYTGAPTTQATAAQPGYNSAGLYDPNAAAAYTQQGYGAPAQQQPYYPSADQGQPAPNVAMQNQFYNPDYARAAAPAAAPSDPSAAAYGYPAAGAPAAYSDPSYATQPPTTAAAYPQTGYGAPDASGAPAPQYGGAAAYTADTRSAAPGTPGAPEMQGAGAYPAYAPTGEVGTVNGSAWSNTSAPTPPPASDPTMNQPPGQTGYAPGQTGYQPAGTSAYQAPAPVYQTPGMPPAAAPAAGGARGATPYRPGSTGDYRSSGANTFRAATPGGEYEPSAGVSPASYETMSAPEAPSATVNP